MSAGKTRLDLEEMLHRLRFAADLLYETGSIVPLEAVQLAIARLRERLGPGWGD